MTVETEILPFAIGVDADVQSQADYEAADSTTNGFANGIADPAKLNKVWRQSSFIAAGIANWLVSQNISVPDDGDLPALVDKIQDGIVAAIDAELGTLAGLRFIGTIDCSANPNYPASDAGDVYVVSVAGKIGGGSGAVVNAGDTVICKVTNAGGTQAAVGANFVIIEGNLGYTPLNAANNLSDVANAATSRSNISAAASGANTDITSVALDQTGLKIKGGSANKLNIKPNETLSAERVLSVVVNDANRSLTIAGDATISGTNTGDETTTTAGSLINGATAKSTPVDADFIGLMDSAASNVLKKLSWANIKATLKAYFDTLYAAVGTTGSEIYLTSVSVAAGANLDVTNQIDWTLYNEYVFKIYNGLFSSNATLLFVRCSTDGSTFDTGNNYSWAHQYNATGGGGAEGGSGEAQLRVISNANGVSNSASKGMNLTLTVSQPNSGTFNKVFRVGADYDNGAGNYESMVGGGRYQSASTLRGIRFLPAGGSITMTVYVYGRKTS